MTSQNINEIIEKIRKFNDERDWAQFHNHKDMAISLVLEAVELLDLFRWKSKEEVNEYVEKNKDKVSDELADVAMNVFEIADNVRIDLGEAIDKKMIKNAKKYPIDKAKGSCRKYNEF